MAYSTNPFLPRVRMTAVLLVRKGWTVRQTARYIGVAPGTVSKWMQRAPADGREGIPTKSSRPHTSPGKLAPDIEAMIVDERQRTNRCGQVIHHVLNRRGVVVSLTTVHRVLDRYRLTRAYSPWKRRHVTISRPDPENPGDLVEVDTIHFVRDTRERTYVYALIDVCSRWAYAWASTRINAFRSIRFITDARSMAPFSFQLIQTDHGSEFSTHFTERIAMPHRHTRIRKPNDNGHIERFIRTLQDECLKGLAERLFNPALREYLMYYNEQRPHMGIAYLTPQQKLEQLFPRS